MVRTLKGCQSNALESYRSFSEELDFEIYKIKYKYYLWIILAMLAENFTIAVSCVQIFTFSHLAEAFIQRDLQMRTIEAIKTQEQ